MLLPARPVLRLFIIWIMEKTILIIIPEKDFSDDEYLEIKQLLADKGAILKNVSTNPEEAVGISGTKALMDVSFDTINFEDYDGAILIGGNGTHSYLSNPEVKVTIKNFLDHGKLLAAISTAPEILASAGVLAGKRSTVTESGKEMIMAAGAVYSDEDVCVDGNIITAASSAHAQKFAQVIADRLGL